MYIDMKRWMLDAVVGLGSLFIFLGLVIVIPMIIPGDIAYLIALLLFVGVISIGGYIIRNTA